MMATRQARPVPLLGELLAGIADAGEAALVPVSGLATDSRTVRQGDVFLACQGGAQHGLAHLDEALRCGAIAVVWERTESVQSVPEGLAVPAVGIGGLSQCVGPIASRYFGDPSRAMTIIGVTGTDGKTSVSQLLAQALDQDEAPCGVIGTLGMGRLGALSPASHTTPDALTLQHTLAAFRDQGTRWVSMEVSSHALAQGRVNGVAFDYAIFTNLSRDHLDYHGDMHAYAQAKRRLFEVPSLDTAILNVDDPYGRELSAQLQGHRRVFGYTLAEDSGVDCEVVRADRVVLDRDGIRARVRTPWGLGELETRLLGRFNLQNLLATLTTMLAIGVDLAEALVRLRQLRAVPGRMEVLGGDGAPLIIVDYAHTPAALAHVLAALREHCVGRLWCVFGCGGERDRGKRPLMAAIVEQHADRIIVTDDNPRNEDADAIIADILGGFERPAQVRVERDRAEAIALATRQAEADDVVLVAGKGHETEQIVGGERHPFSDRRQVERILQEGAR